MSRCEAIKYIGDAGYFRLECHLDQRGHLDALHWDQGHELVWAPWTAADEQEVRDADSPRELAAKLRKKTQQ